MCDYATCTTRALCKRIELLGKKCSVVPNTINKCQFELAQEIKGANRATDGTKVRIGYFSGTRTHDKDFMEVSDALYEVMGKNPIVKFHLVGILDLDPKFLTFGKRIVRQPLMDYIEMQRYLAGMDINLAPLEMNNAFTAGKSELKIFEAALLGIPTVASATDSYAGCITDGVNGFLAATKEEWVEKLEKLIQDAELRLKIAGQAEKDFAQRYFIKNVIKDVIGSYAQIAADHRKALKGEPLLTHDDILNKRPLPQIRTQMEKINNKEGGNSTLKIDLGCGGAKREGFIGLDYVSAPGVDYVLDLTKDRLPFDDNTVHHVFSAHFLEHLAAPNHIFQEIARVCRDGAKIEFWTPYAFSKDAFLYGHVTFLTEQQWLYFCFYNRDNHLDILGGRWLLKNINYVVPGDVEAELTNRGFSVNFALRYFHSVVTEYGVEIEFRRDLEVPPVMPTRTFSHSRYGERFQIDNIIQ
jgi:SAM-dependent methyltransferase